MSSKLKSPLSSKRSKTESIVNSAFDESVVFIAVTKIQKCLYDISKSKFDKIHQAIKVVNRDINVISDESREKEKVNLLGMHLLVFEEINEKKYSEGLNIINKKELRVNERSNPVLKLSILLLKSLLLRFLEREEESEKILSQAIGEVDLTNLKIKSKTLDYKILEATLICISIVADYFNEFESHSQQFRSIYAKAYHISHKYLTQYHKLTETLYSICKKFPNKTNSQQQEKKILSKRHSLAVNSNRSVIKHSRSDRSSLDSSQRTKPIYSSTENSETKQDLRKPKPKRLKTLDPYIDLQESKEKCLSKLYGIESTESKLKFKKLFKRPKMSTSLKTSTNEHEEKNEMKDLESISEIYLPKISAQRKKQEKLNAADILKYGSSLEKLKPNYFDKLTNSSNQKEMNPKKELRTPPIHEKKNPNVEKPTKSENKIKNTDEDSILKDNTKNGKNEKEKALHSVKPENISPSKEKEEQGGCQLI